MDERIPVVTGPVTGGRHGWPFGGPIVDLAQLGYRQDEYFLEGVATRYALAPGCELRRDGHWQVEPAQTAPYRTRIVVVRPDDPAAFDGTVVLLWNNVSAGYDAFGGGDSRELFGSGSAYVAVSAQRVSVHGAPDHPQGLRAWDPERYGTLSITSDDYSFDIFTQAARAIAPGRPREPVDPMGGLDVRQVVAQGASQSAGRLATYVNAVQPRAGIIDGFLLTLYFGTGASLEVGDDVMVLGAMDAADGGRRELVGSHLLRDDLAVPVMVVNSECEAPAHVGVRQPDTDRYRYWEAAGTSHFSLPDMRGAAPRFERDLGFSIPVMDEINQVSLAPVIDAALHHLRRWVGGGAPPPVVAPIEFAGDPPEIRRDELGIAQGGIRLPQVEVPLARNGAEPLGPDVFSRLAGSCRPFSAEQVRRLYRSNDEYLARFEQATRAAEKVGVILPRDAEGLLAEARASRPLPD